MPLFPSFSLSNNTTGGKARVHNYLRYKRRTTHKGQKKSKKKYSLLCVCACVSFSLSLSLFDTLNISPFFFCFFLSLSLVDFLFSLLPKKNTTLCQTGQSSRSSYSENKSSFLKAELFCFQSTLIWNFDQFDLETIVEVAHRIFDF